MHGQDRAHHWVRKPCFLPRRKQASGRGSASVALVAALNGGQFNFIGVQVLIAFLELARRRRVTPDTRWARRR